LFSKGSGKSKNHAQLGVCFLFAERIKEFNERSELFPLSPRFSK
jgi:hypothetical protein